MIVYAETAVVQAYCLQTHILKTCVHHQSISDLQNVNASRETLDPRALRSDDFFFHHRSKYSAAINPEVPKTQGVCIHWTGQLDWTTELTFCHIKKIYRYTIRLSTSLANALKPPQGDTCSLVSCQLVYVTVVTPVRLLL